MSKFKKKSLVNEEKDLNSTFLEAYKELPDEVEAVQFNGVDLPSGVMRNEMDAYIETPKGKVIIQKNHWLVTDANGELSVWTPQIFEDNYEKA